MRMWHFQVQNGPFVMNRIFLVQITNRYYYFHLPIGPFHCAKFEKNSYRDPELWGCANFGCAICHKKIFFWKINIILIYLLAPLIVQNSKRILPADPELCTIFGPKWPISPSENFFRKPVNESCFFRSCLSICQKSKSDINILLKYWRLKNTEISLAESHFWL